MNSKNLLYKEFKLALHPTCFIFFALSAMMLIPNYPLYVTFFYTTLGLFFTFINGRENHDIYFTLMLPIKKEDVVKSRFTMIVVIELIQLFLAGIMSLIRTIFMKLPNQAGMDANIALFGFAFVLFGLFNLIFLTSYYKDTNKIGVPFLISGIVIFVYIGVVEVCSFIIPFFHNVLDTQDPQFLLPKLVVLLIGILVFSLLTLFSRHLSIKNFDKSDF